MSKVDDPIMKPWSRSSSGGTRVSFSPDLSRFPPLKETDILRVMHTRCLDVAACNPHLRVTFNDEELSCSFQDYFSRFELHSLGSAFVSLSPSGWEVGIGVTDSPSPSQQWSRHISFVNSINTLRGGTHVDHITDQIARAVVATMKRELPSITPAAVKSHLIVFLNAIVPNPTFDSQTKVRRLNSYTRALTSTQPPNSSGNTYNSNRSLFCNSSKRIYFKGKSTMTNINLREISEPFFFLVWTFTDTSESLTKKILPFLAHFRDSSC